MLSGDMTPFPGWAEGDFSVWLAFGRPGARHLDLPNAARSLAPRLRDAEVGPVQEPWRRDPEDDGLA